jgi:hypothetical protein
LHEEIALTVGAELEQIQLNHTMWQTVVTILYKCLRWHFSLMASSVVYQSVSLKIETWAKHAKGSSVTKAIIGSL